MTDVWYQYSGNTSTLPSCVGMRASQCVLRCYTTSLQRSSGSLVYSDIENVSRDKGNGELPRLGSLRWLACYPISYGGYVKMLFLHRPELLVSTSAVMDAVVVAPAESALLVSRTHCCC